MVTARDTSDSKHRPIRIAIVVRRFPLLEQTFLRGHIFGMVDLGADVSVITSPVLRNETAAVIPAERQAIMSEIIHYRQTTRVSLVRVIAHYFRNPGKIGRLIFKLLRSPSSPNTTRRHLIREVASALSVGQVDVYHCHWGSVAARFVEALDALKDKTPIVTTFHGRDVTKYVAHHGPYVYRQLFSRGKLFLPVSDYFRERLIALGAPRDRTLVHHMGVNVDDFIAQPKGSRAKKSLQVLAVGRLVEKKGFHYGLQAIAAVNTQGIPITLTIAGDGPERADLERLAKRLGISAYVQFLGYQPHRAIATHMHDHDVLIAPSITAHDNDMEGIPVVIMESMACGLPVIASNHSGIPELVKDGITGLLAEEGDVDTLANHLILLAENPQRRAELGRQGLHLVEEEFNLRTLNAELMALYVAISRSDYLMQKG